MVIPGHDKFEVPMIEKKNAQVLSITGNTASLMDNETFENLDLEIPEDLQGSIGEGSSVEYWDVEGDKLLKRAL